jgi:tagatose 6-phosphate kinase
VLLVVCPNLALDRILEVDRFEAARVQRSRSAFTQPGGKGSNVARVFCRMGGDVVLVGCCGKRNPASVQDPLLALGIHVDLIPAYAGDTRTCTIICDPVSQSHPTVVNEETPQIDDGVEAKLLRRIEQWLPRVDGVFTTGSLSTGLPDDFYLRILEYARQRGKLTAIDAAGAILRAGLCAHPTFAKPNAEEFRTLIDHSTLFTLATHMAVTLGKKGAVLIHEGKCIYAPPPRIFETNPIGAGDTFAAAYMRYLLQRRTAADCLRLAMAAAANDVSTIAPGSVNPSQVHSLARQVELRFL